MMKKIRLLINYGLRVLLIFSILSCYIIEPMQANAATKATTLAGLRKELSDLQAKKKDVDNQKNMTQAQIDKKNAEIRDSYKEIENSEIKIDEAKQNIEDSKLKIKDYEKQTEDLMAFYQIMSGENAYLEFISDSSSMTELIMRSDAVDAIISYNEEKLEELEMEIENLEQQQIDLLKYEEELNKNILSYEAKIKELDTSLLFLSDDAMDINEEISMVKELIDYYEKLGCKENESFEACMSSSNNNTWLKPVTKGRINSLFGWRTIGGKSNFHSGIDIGVNEGTTVYAMASGTVINVQYKTSCGGNKVYVQSKVGGEMYTVSYVHLLSINSNIKKGTKVTTETVIGKSGGYSTAKRYGGYDTCTTGAHLHVSVSKGYYTSWAKFQANLIKPPGFPGKGAYFYSRTQWFN